MIAPSVLWLAALLVPAAAVEAKAPAAVEPAAAAELVEADEAAVVEAAVVENDRDGDGVDDADHAWGFAAVPTLTFNTDEGFGTGGVATIFHRHEGYAPYRDSITFNLFISTKLVQAHAITWDALDPFGLPGRMYVRVGYYSTVTQNYCGVGNAVTCAPGVARDAARDAGLREGSDDFEAFERRYHLMRFIRPYATAILRPRLRDKPWRTELLVGWRGSYTFPGDLFEPGPYAGSRYALDFPGGEPGFSSVPFVGVVVDDRDDEVFATRGFYAEASVRGAHPFTGATWTYAGGTAVAAAFFNLMPGGYAPEPGEPRLVLATRGIVDVLVGDPSIEELARIGGTLDPIAWGGAYLGRGVREHRYLGKLKVMNQTELRAQLWDVELFGQRLSFGPAVFADVAWIGFDALDLRGSPLKVLSGAGVSWRTLWNENFALRFDLAASPDEREGPGFYMIVGQAF